MDDAEAPVLALVTQARRQGAADVPALHHLAQLIRRGVHRRLVVGHQVPPAGPLGGEDAVQLAIDGQMFTIPLAAISRANLKVEI